MSRCTGSASGATAVMVRSPSRVAQACNSATRVRR
ncbi:Uncharacterised protein [Mycobacteroides abscessus subsp. abscessus]|nr:Uncharacterised protein [Mycobacteroides abscessus subsp. abscessus]